MQSLRHFEPTSCWPTAFAGPLKERWVGSNCRLAAASCRQTWSTRPTSRTEEDVLVEEARPIADWASTWNTSKLAWSRVDGRNRMDRELWGQMQQALGDGRSGCGKQNVRSRSMFGWTVTVAANRVVPAHLTSLPTIVCSVKFLVASRYLVRVQRRVSNAILTSTYGIVLGTCTHRGAKTVLPESSAAD